MKLVMVESRREGKEGFGCLVGLFGPFLGLDENKEAERFLVEAEKLIEAGRFDRRGLIVIATVVEPNGLSLASLKRRLDEAG